MNRSILTSTLGRIAVLIAVLFAASPFALASGENVNVNLGNLPPGKTVQITYSVTVDATLPSGASTISNQGTISCDGGTSLLTGDPDETNAGDPSDATLTSAFGPPPAGPEIDVLGNGMSIAGDGTNVPMAGDDTDFGSSLVGVPTAETTFVIDNSGVSSLIFTSLIIGGTNGGDFSVTTIPAGTVPNPGTTNLGITFTPGAVGSRTATVTINSNDADESPYVFNIAGTGTLPPADSTPPVIHGAKDIVVTIPKGGTSDPIFYSLTATDETAPAMPGVTCSPASGGTYTAGVHPVLCSAMDAAGNTATASFNIVVLEQDDSPGERFLDAVSLRGDPAIGAAGTIFTINRAYLNNSGTVLFDAVLSGAGTNNIAVFRGSVFGPQAAIAVKNTASGVGDFGTFSNLTLNDNDAAGFQSQIGANAAQFVDAGAGPAVAAVRGGIAPTGGGELYSVLQKPALSENGQLLTPASLLIGSGNGVTSADDTIITSSAGTVIAREGGATSIAATGYGQIHPRVVASENNDHHAFASFLVETPFDAATNTALFEGLVGPAPGVVAREGGAADGTPGAFSHFLGETVNSAGETAFRAFVSGPGINSSNNEGLWTTSGSATPILVAREGDVAPCLPNTLVAFDRFTTIGIADDGSVCFFAYLKDAGFTPAVDSSNDGSIWRWENGNLHLIAREGTLANNTDGAVIRTLGNFACSGTGGIVYAVSLSAGIGDTLTSTDLAVYLDRGAFDPAPQLILRRGDTFNLSGIERTVVGITLSTESNVGGGTGGYGRSINDMGGVLLNLTLSGNTGGIFILSPSPPM